MKIRIYSDIYMCLHTEKRTSPHKHLSIDTEYFQPRNWFRIQEKIRMQHWTPEFLNKDRPHKVTLQKQKGPTNCCSSVVTEGYIWEGVQTRRQ